MSPDESLSRSVRHLDVQPSHPSPREQIPQTLTSIPRAIYGVFRAFRYNPLIRKKYATGTLLLSRFKNRLNWVFLENTRL